MNSGKLIQLLIVFIIGLSAFTCSEFLSFRSGSLTEKEALKIAKKFSPVVIFDKAETYWPAAIEWFRIDWSTVTDKNDVKSHVSFDYQGPEHLNEDTPFYVSLKENEDGSIRISYAFLYPYNGCGPYLKVNLNTIFGFNTEQRIPLCPVGLHWGDIERVTVNVSADHQTLQSVVFAYHDSDKEYFPNEIDLKKGRRPVVYVAPGSHASYPQGGEHSYLNAWSFKANTFSTTGVVADEMENPGKVWKKAEIRLLKLNDQPTSDISEDERWLAFDFHGKLGAPMTNVNFDFFLQEANAYAQVVKSMNETAYQYIVKALYLATLEIKKNAPPTLADRPWW